MDTKRCLMCLHDKPLSEFGTKRHLRDGLNTRCKRCVKNVECIRIFGFTYDELVDRFGDKCNQCGELESIEGSSLSVDHDHDCCKYGCEYCIRGLLCRRCNYVTGVVESVGPKGIQTILKYLGGEYDAQL